MQKTQVAIIGHGFVGKGMSKIFPDAYVYDPKYPVAVFAQDEKDPNVGYKLASIADINQTCGLAIVCVPTPPVGMNGEQRVDDDEDQFRAVDLSIVEDILAQLETPLILIKSTIPPGTTEMLKKKYGKRICFSPEYMGEGNYYTPPKYPDPLDPRKHDFMVIGGDVADCDEILSYFMEKLGPAKTYSKMTATEAELVKYIENTWGAMKVTFANEWAEICNVFGASYETVRQGWLLDSRTEPMHTAVFARKRGFGGKCYPKDLMGIIAQAQNAGYVPTLLMEVWQSNKRFRKLNPKQ